MDGYSIYQRKAKRNIYKELRVKHLHCPILPFTQVNTE